jgi:tetratricopeptide (TPR) repeat protein
MSHDRDQLRRILKELEERPHDVRLLQKAGEICQRMNDNKLAAEYFGRVAAEYESDGFFLKAIALFKQVTKLDSDRPEIYVRIADLHFKIQLETDGRKYLEAALAGFNRAGRHAEARTVRERLGGLDYDLQNPKAKA